MAFFKSNRYNRAAPMRTDLSPSTPGMDNVLMIGAAGWMCLCASANPIEPLPQNRTSRIGGLRQKRQGFRGIVELILAAEEMDSILCNSLPKRLLLAMALSRRKLRQRSRRG